jgi:hypothetical protein
MAWRAQRIFPVPYQWRRIVLIVTASVSLVVAGKLVHASLPVAIALAAAFPLVLVPLRFYRPDELASLRRLMLGWRS